jgi:flagellar secretion chaperone FliS
MTAKDAGFAYNQYNQVAALGAGPVEQVVALYDRVLRDFHACIAAIAAGKIEKRVRASNHALLIIGELQGVLDFAQGGEAARNLDSFYKVTRPMITQASMNNSAERFQELVAMYGRLRAAWAQVARSAAAPASVPTDQPRPMAAAENPRASAAAKSARTRNKPVTQKASTPKLEAEESSTGRWSA